VDFGPGKRFDIALSLDASGDTVVGLNTSITGSGPFERTGPTYTLSGLGSTYHAYDLLFEPGTQSADLYVDGVLRIADYQGFTYPVVTYAGLFGAANSGTVNFNNVTLTVGAPVPIPAAFWLFGSALAGFAFVGKRRGI